MSIESVTFEKLIYGVLYHLFSMPDSHFFLLAVTTNASISALAVVGEKSYTVTARW